MTGKDDGSIAIGSRATMADMIMHLDQAGQHHRALLVRAAMTGQIALIEVARDGRPRLAELARIARPVLVLLGDDDYASTGPRGWAAVRRLSGWTRKGMIHASGASEASYQRAVESAIACRRFVLVETTSAHARGWLDALFRPSRPVPIELILPEGEHPIAPAVLQ